MNKFDLTSVTFMHKFDLMSVPPLLLPSVSSHEGWCPLNGQTESVGWVAFSWTPVWRHRCTACDNSSQPTTQRRRTVCAGGSLCCWRFGKHWNKAFLHDMLLRKYYHLWLWSSLFILQGHVIVEDCFTGARHDCGTIYFTGACHDCGTVCLLYRGPPWLEQSVYFTGACRDCGTLFYRGTPWLWNTIYFTGACHDCGTLFILQGHTMTVEHCLFYRGMPWPWNTLYFTADLFTPLFTCQYFGQKLSVIQGVCQ